MPPDPPGPFDVADNLPEGEPEADPSVFSEPWMDGSRGSPTAREEPAHRADSQDSIPVEQGVWNEPALLRGSSAPEGAATWGKWFRQQQAETTTADSVTTFFVVSLLGGPLAVIGAIFAMTMGVSSFANVVVIGPATEEVLKVAAVVYVVERYPYRFKSAFQLVFAVAASGLVFAVIENLLYLNVYIEDPTPEIRAWRWIACTILHVLCCLITSIGLVRIWRHTNEHATQPEFALGAPLLIAAVVVHGLYNLSALMIETFLKPF